MGLRCHFIWGYGATLFNPQTPMTAPSDGDTLCRVPGSPSPLRTRLPPRLCVNHPFFAPSRLRTHRHFSLSYMRPTGLACRMPVACLPSPNNRAKRPSARAPQSLCGGATRGGRVVNFVNFRLLRHETPDANIGTMGGTLLNFETLR